MESIHHQLEEATDELARLDTVAGLASSSVTIALRLSAIAELVRFDDPTTALSFNAIASAQGDPIHAAALSATTLHWRDLMLGDERRVRGGAPLTVPRFAAVSPALATYVERSRLEAIWREGGSGRPILERALDAAAWAPSRAVGEAAATLLLCAGGRTDKVRLLCFGDVEAAEQADATSAWRAGDELPWRARGLQAVARRARALRRAVTAVVVGAGDEDSRLDPLGRAAINARRALARLRSDLVVTVPTLAESLALSRPAATDALERLHSLGLARELTGRARDRVFAYDAAVGVANVLGVPAEA